MDTNQIPASPSFKHIKDIKKRPLRSSSLNKLFNRKTLGKENFDNNKQVTEIEANEETYMFDAFQLKYIKEVLFDGNFEVLTEMESLVPSVEFDTIASIFLDCLSSFDSVHGYFKLKLSNEIQQTSSDGTLFRGVSLNTKMVSNFLRREGHTLLKEIVVPIVEICSRHPELEIDPTRLSDETGKIDDSIMQDILKNRDILLKVCEESLEIIFKAQNKVPNTFRYLFNIVQKLVVDKFPTMEQSVIGGFFFLRFLSPALVTPKHSGLVSQEISNSTKRNLILVGKVIQNLSNNMLFDKEVYMLFLNDFLKNNLEKMKNFLSQISIHEIDEKTMQDNRKPDTFTHLLSLFEYLEELKDRIIENLELKEKIGLVPGFLYVLSLKERSEEIERTKKKRKLGTVVTAIKEGTPIKRKKLTPRRNCELN